MFRAFALAVLLLIPSAAQAQHRPPSLSELSLQTSAMGIASEPLPSTAPERPPLSRGRVAGQLAAGVLGGTLGAVVLGGAMAALMADQAEGWGGLIGAVLGATVGYPVGAAGGVLVTGRTSSQTGSALATFAGSAAGALAGAALVEATSGVSYLVLVPVGATVGFNLTRRYRTPPPEQSQPSHAFP